MTPEQFHRVEEIFAAACALPQPARAAYIDEASSGDSAIAERVHRMLVHDAKPALDVHSTIGGAVRAASHGLIEFPKAQLPNRIGGYRIIRQIGEGGFGVVYLAEQESPRRTVALKVVRWALATADTVRRFEHEAHVLGRLQHPGIAQIFEAGIAEVVFDSAKESPPVTSVPFYAMEYIRGPNLLAYADAPQVHQPPLNLQERLELIARVCDGLQHAHQNGIIHRDLKPDNILVVDTTGGEVHLRSRTRQLSAQPKLLDFGVARAMEREGQGTVVQTAAGQVIGTPAYMSPEQVAGDGDEIDTRSDLYSVGVLLYQLMTGRLPYQVERANLPEVARIITEEPPAPMRASAGLSSTGSRFNADVEAIVAKALDKNRDRRYQSAADFAADIRRFLNGEPIEAKRESAMYLLRKSVQRYRGALSAAAAFVILLGGFAAWAASQARTNRRLADDSWHARNDAIAERDRANQTADRLAAEMSQSNIDRGRALAAADNYFDAERLIWREYLDHPDSVPARWALRELYTRYANRASFHTRIPSIRAHIVSPDETLVAVGGEASVIELWDLQSQSLTASLTGHTNFVEELDFTRDGRLLASAGRDETIRIWSIEHIGQSRLLTGHKGVALALCFDSTGRILYSGGVDRLLRIWDVSTGELRASIRGFDSYIARLRLSPDGRTLALGTGDGRVMLWDTAHLPTTAESPASTEPIDPPAGARRADLAAHLDRVVMLTFSRDSRFLASTGWSSERAVRIWDVDSGKLKDTLISSQGAIEALAFSPDGRRLYAGGWFTIDVWDLGTSKRIGSLSKGKCSDLTACADGRRVISTTDRDVRILDTSLTPAQTRLGPHSGRTVAYSADGQWLATAQDEGIIELRDPVSGDLVKTFTPDGATPLSDRIYRVRAVGFNADSSQVVAVDYKSVLRTWDVNSGRCEQTIQSVNYVTQQSVAYRPDGRQWAYVNRSPDFSIASLTDPADVKILKNPRAQPLSICFSPDGRFVATASREEAICLWTSNGEFVARLPCHGVPWGVAFSPDSRKVLTGTWVFTIPIWDVETQKLEHVLEGHSATVWAVEFKPDDLDVFGSCSSDGTVRLWSLSTGRNLATLDACPGEEAIAFSFSPDGHRMAVASSGDEVRIWDLGRLDLCIEGNRQCQLGRLQEGDAAAMPNQSSDSNNQSPARTGP